ncbi:molybdenum cofactor guanylyltransferase [Halanaerobium sp. MA284_MarDTE_T2]|nr:molybdenum cofactor guanylyltransferase [Halanaerobium sp. MA284_MarDTE_T2]RCW80742.1 molybdenum cofactor guanylyltransferase [Halanaerobium sp. DL-01]
MILKINAILLAGGESSRYGENKALLSFKNKPLIEYVYNKLDSHFDNVIIIGPPKTYSFIAGAEIREDIIKNKGPLGGLYTGLYYSSTEYNFLAGCDMPFLDDDYFSFLEKKLQKELVQNKYEILVSEYNGYLEPLAAIYSKNLLDKIKASLFSSELKIKSIYNKSRIKIIKEEELDSFFNLKKLFFNINYPQDKKAAENFLDIN